MSDYIELDTDLLLLAAERRLQLARSRRTHQEYEPGRETHIAPGALDA